MNITSKEVSYVADLANLELTEEERVRMVRDLNSILGYIDTLNELDTSNVPPMAQVAAGAQASGENVAAKYELREDHPGESLPHEAALANAPDHNADFFKVPKVIER